jgi:hypothetical protein
MLPPSTRSPQLLSLGFSAGHCGEDPVKDRRPLDREAQRVTPEASSHCEPTSGEPCAPVRAARCWILYAPFFRARANSAWAGLRARILYRPCPGGRIQGGRSGSSTSFTSVTSRLLPFSSVAIPSDAKRDLSIRMRPVCTCLRSVHERLSMQPSAREGRRVLPSSRRARAIHSCNTWPGRG